MVLAAIKVFAQLARLDAAAVVFVALFMPILYAGHSAFYAFTRAMPLTFICMCGFVINNIFDIEKDRENHPTRPLPSGRISPSVASFIYFMLLAVSLSLVHGYSNSSNIF